ncbi:P-loop containing nucleoside triphosphate hydrolase protein [Polychytrium aggregatum]|uniref:P-loop containing nucleoside triphosphate hydrolase protein n=1 Tax=Polychytrium aggregatum TaxID=110093 RepID=UPI0022FEAEF9|nr:P-loop containing nucleoside triphosphate hydrolase protein [Polychytrium aggregatum]KAI9190566.1 P-loop containing nucleoside triphosphate hydrolase protein [Polychytrium aggregatum]
MPDRIITPPKAVDVFVVDECQDLDEGLNQYIHCFIRDLETYQQRPLQLVFLGDPLQAIYGYRGGDARYLTMVSDIYPDRQWGHFGLSVSHRLTEGVVDYMKQHITGMEKVKLVGSRRHHHAIRHDLHSVHDVVEEIIKLHDHFSVAYDDIIILANSTKLVQYNRPTTVGELDQQLTLRRIPLFIAGDLAESKLDLQRGKLRIMTFIRSKGLQCRHTFLVDYGTKKFRYEPQLPTSVFVAMTRATDTLYLVTPKGDQRPEFDRYQRPPAVQMELKRKREELITDRADKAAKQPKTKKMLSVGQLLSHLPQRQMIDAFRSVNIRTVYEESYRINIRNQSTQEYNGIRLHEDVSAINGNAISMKLELACMGLIKTPNRRKWRECFKHGKQAPVPSCFSCPSEIFEPRPEDRDNVETNRLILRLAHYATLKDQPHLLHQISSLNWLDSVEFNRCCRNGYALLKRLLAEEHGIAEPEAVLAKDTIFERPVNLETESFKISGRLDMWIEPVQSMSRIVIELKSVSMLTPEHVLQTALYKWITGATHAYCFNTLTGEIVEVTNPAPSIEATYAILNNKAQYLREMGNPEFIERNCFPSFVQAP